MAGSADDESLASPFGHDRGPLGRWLSGRAGSPVPMAPPARQPCLAPPAQSSASATFAASRCYDRYMRAESPPDGEPFLLVSVSTAGGPPSLRVQVWRKLRSLGALYLQQSVCLLPAWDRPTREVRRLLARVHAAGGTGRVLTITVPAEQERAALVAEFNAARDAEYGEVLERTPALLDEIATETARGRATYVEVEESEADLDRFRAWLAKIAARDYFGAAGRAAAEAGTDTEDATTQPTTGRTRLTIVEGS